MNQPTATEVENAQPSSKVFKELSGRRISAPMERIINVGPSHSYYTILTQIVANLLKITRSQNDRER